MNVAILGSNFTTWTGGIDFIKAYILALHNIPDVKVFIFLTDHWNPISKWQAVKNKIKIKLHREVIDYFKEHASPFLDEQNVTIIGYKTDDNNFGLLEKLKECNIDVIFPTLVSLGSDFPIPWIPYIYDFQHKYLPELFTSEERVERDSYFEKMVYQSKFSIVEAKDVKKDIERFYPKAKTNVYVMPYTAIPKVEWLNLEDVDLINYKLPDNYFLISNQFWLHKDHLTAFKALAKISKTNNISIVCTGNLNDYRNLNYIQEIKNKLMEWNISDKVIMLGLIPKRDQMKIMTKSVAVIQPTLFEGNPGGGIAYNAMSLDIPIILSDISVNKELKYNKAIFFEAGNSDSLAKEMKKILTSKSNIKRKSIKELKKSGDKRLNILSNEIRNLLFTAVKDYNIK